jgi:hypothetical protein
MNTLIKLALIGLMPNSVMCQDGLVSRLLKKPDQSQLIQGTAIVGGLIGGAVALRLGYWYGIEKPKLIGGLKTKQERSVTILNESFKVATTLDLLIAKKSKMLGAFRPQENVRMVEKLITEKDAELSALEAEFYPSR